MADDFSRAMRERPPFSNADDPRADRLATHGEAGELNPAQGVHPRVGPEHGPGTAPSGPDMSGKDAELLQAGGPGDRIGGPHATDRPRDGGEGSADGGEGSADGGEGSLVDRLDR